MPVTRFEITRRRPLAEGAAFGDTGAYEELKGRLHFTIDPLHPSNTRITDVELAPRDQAGRVTFSSEVSLLVPVDRTRCRGGVLLDIVNRGNTIAVPNFNRATRPVFGPNSDPNPPIDTGDGFLMRRGFVVLSCAWQGDLPDLPGLLRLHGPDALHPDGRPITGRVHAAPEPRAHRVHAAVRSRSPALSRRRSRRARRAAHRARSAGRRAGAHPARALALREGDRRARGP